MARFRFRLQKVLDIRQMIEDQLVLELARLRAELESEQARLVELVSEMEAHKAVMKRRLTEADAEKIRESYEYIQSLRRRILEQEKVVAEAAQRRDEKLTETIQASQDRKVMERLKERQQAEHQAEMLSEEQKSLDDMASARRHAGTRAA